MNALSELVEKWQEVLDADDNGRTRLKSEFESQAESLESKRPTACTVGLDD